MTVASAPAAKARASDETATPATCATFWSEDAEARTELERLVRAASVGRMRRAIVAGGWWWWG